jgi:short-subunit dehydrogenase
MWKPSYALITGASSGLGESFARKLAARGVNLVIAARRADKLQVLAQELRDAHRVNVEVFSLDLSFPGAAQSLFNYCDSRNIMIDFLINNAGIGEFKDFSRTDLTLHTQAIELNIRSLTELTYLFVQQMQVSGIESRILNVSSVASYQPVPRYAVYAGSKSFIRVFSQILRYELQDSKIGVCCLCPGGTLTEFLENNNQRLRSKGHKALMSASEVTEAAITGAINNRALIIPGFFNKLTVLFSLILPDAWTMRLATRAMDFAVEEKS